MGMVWTLWSASNAEHAQSWQKVAVGDDADFPTMLADFLRWKAEGQRVRLEWSEAVPPEVPQGVEGFSINGR